MEAERDRARGSIAVPASTAAPLVASVGVTLLLAGLVTNAAVSAVGAVLFVSGALAWFREVLPQERHEPAALERPPEQITQVRHAVRRLATAAGPHRARLPVEVYPLSAGIRGGIAGGIAMAVLAGLHGLINHGSLWYTINLLAAAGSSTLSNASPEALRAFNAEGLVLAFVIHAVISLLVGLLYGALLPMVPRHPVWWGGLVVPLLWTGLIAATLDLINPALNRRIEWPWFLASQIAFGLVAGLVVTRSARIATFQPASFTRGAPLETQDER
jgi:hypothetical protein